MNSEELAPFHDALLTPDACGIASELRGGTPILKEGGYRLPWYTGGHAVVTPYRIGGQRKAVRVFTDPGGLPDIEFLYASLKATLKEKPCSAFADFSFHREGLRVDGRVHPVLIMDWVEGDPLHRYVQRNLLETARIAALATQWAELLRGLEQRHIAHGDLHPRNILISGPTDAPLVRLVDYDSAVVDALLGRDEPLAGVPGFTHPQRRTHAFKRLDTDVVPGALIYVALRALVCDFRIASERDIGEDCLLFRPEDLERPAASARFRQLLALPDTEVAELSAWVADACAKPEPATFMPISNLIRSRPHAQPETGGTPPSARPRFERPKRPAGAPIDEGTQLLSLRYPSADGPVAGGPPPPRAPSQARSPFEEPSESGEQFEASRSRLAVLKGCRIFVIGASLAALLLLCGTLALWIATSAKM